LDKAIEDIYKNDPHLFKTLEDRFNNVRHNRERDERDLGGMHVYQPRSFFQHNTHTHLSHYNRDFFAPVFTDPFLGTAIDDLFNVNYGLFNNTARIFDSVRRAAPLTFDTYANKFRARDIKGKKK